MVRIMNAIAENIIPVVSIVCICSVIITGMILKAIKKK